MATHGIRLLDLLVNEYVPALMHLGIAVRDLYWEHRQPGTGSFARDVLSRCLVLLLSLENCRSTEYVRGLSLALCLWTDEVHGRLPGCCFVEEALEGSLSRLSRAAGTDLRATTVDDFCDLYAALGPSRHE